MYKTFLPYSTLYKQRHLIPSIVLLGIMGVFASLCMKSYKVDSPATQLMSAKSLTPLLGLHAVRRRSLNFSFADLSPISA